jgi:hypothetical protein
LETRAAFVREVKDVSAGFGQTRIKVSVDIRYNRAEGNPRRVGEEGRDTLCKIRGGPCIEAVRREVPSSLHGLPVDQTVVGAGIADINAKDLHSGHPAASSVPDQAESDTTIACFTLILFLPSMTLPWISHKIQNCFWQAERPAEGK